MVKESWSGAVGTVRLALLGFIDDFLNSFARRVEELVCLDFLDFSEDSPILFLGRLDHSAGKSLLNSFAILRNEELCPFPKSIVQLVRALPFSSSSHFIEYFKIELYFFFIYIFYTYIFIQF